MVKIMLALNGQIIYFSAYYLLKTITLAIRVNTSLS